MTPYQARIARGLARGLSLTEARGHGKTPENPHRAELPQHRERYSEYIERRKRLKAQVDAKKAEIFGNNDKWRRDRSDRYTEHNPETNQPPRLDYMERFVDDDFDIAEIDWTDDDWAFLYYH